ncbi:hypothetical protein COU59_02645 [Candidatus Pacearchaeota archaeon CG10_big_fil_rev_8_21_14_0_10_34_12]|nr:MAG: hypothetical protein COU59_02645 [Candidatus Pacearchaeota archaeon CG10_big_fil_rev_8_21_14_0_10_34_12]
MGLFNKKDVKRPAPIPALPELPKLPDFPFLDDDDDRHIHRLPSFPSSSLGTKFSQDTIKGAVTGEEEEGDSDADDFAYEDDMRMMQEPLKKSMTQEMPRGFISQKMTRNAEPVFIRVDKFEDAMKIFNETRKKVGEIEHVLADLKALKEKETHELDSWENEIKSLKDQIEKVNTDIFSKV